MIIIRAVPPQSVAINTPVHISAMCATCGDPMNFGFQKVGGVGQISGAPEPKAVGVVSDTPGQGTFQAYDEGGHTGNITVTWFGPPK